MTKIVHVYRTFFPDTQGGLEEVIRQLAKGTLALGHEVKVFTLSATAKNIEQIEFDGIQVIRIPQWIEIASCNISLRGFKEFREACKWADIVHFQFPWPFGDILRLLVPSGTVTLITYQSDIVRQKKLLKIYSPLMNNFLGSVDRIVSTSPNYLKTSPVLQQYKNKTEVIPIGLDEDTYPLVENELLVRMKSSVGEGFFLFVGVLRYYKGLHILLDACVNAEFKAVIVGAGPVEKELKQKAQVLGLTNVVFLGFVSNEEKAALFELCRAVVFPSYLRSEAFGVTLLEGAMHGKPLISSEIGTGTSYVNIHNQTGICVDAANAESLRNAMNKLNGDDSLCKEYGKNSRKRYESHFTGKKMAISYVELYRKLLTEKSIKQGLIEVGDVNEGL